MNASSLSRFIDGWVEAVQRFRFLVIAAVILLTLFSVFYIKDHLGISTDTTDMLSETLPWRQLDIEYEKVFPQGQDNLLIVIESTTPDHSIDAARRLYQNLDKDSGLIEDIYYPAALPYFRQSAFLFLDEEELYDLADRLAAIQPFIGTLLEDKTLRGLFTMLDDALQAIEDGEDIDIRPLLTEINRTLENPDYRVSWQRLISVDSEEKAIYREFIVVRARSSGDELLPGAKLLTLINDTVARLGLEDGTTTVRLTGSEALSYEELKSVSEANITAITASLVMVTLILLIGLGSFWLFFSSLLTLILGLITTTAFAAATVGTLNLISVAFAVLYIGLGIDFAIHMGLRYREESLRDPDNTSALRHATRQMFRSLLLCALTTAIGFYSFIPTDYQGVAELGWIAGSGMFISLLFTFTLLPALLSLKQYKPLNSGPLFSERLWVISLSKLPYRYAGSILLFTVVILIIIVPATSKIRFDTNTLNLQDPNSESVQTYRDLLKNSDTSPWRAVMMKQTREQAKELKNKFDQLAVVDKTVWIEDLLPEAQDEKLFVVDEINLMMGPLTVNTQTPAIDDIARRQTIDQLLSRLERTGQTDFQNELELLESGLKTLQAETENTQQLTNLEQRLLINLDGRIAALADAMNASAVEMEDIPEAVYQRWVNDDTYRLDILPAENLNENSAMKKFVQQLQQIDNSVIGSPIIKIEAGTAVTRAFKFALGYALIAISLLLLILIKHKRDAAIILCSVLVGGVFTFGFMLLLNIPLNFANIIGLPLLLGIGVDSGIHIVHRFRQAPEANIFMTSSSRGVFVSLMTTICSIGNLAFSSHVGTASMGLLLTVGLLSMMISTMLILPAFLIWLTQRQQTTA